MIRYIDYRASFCWREETWRQGLRGALCVVVTTSTLDSSSSPQTKPLKTLYSSFAAYRQRVSRAMSQTTRPLQVPIPQSRPRVPVCLLCYPYLYTCSACLSSGFSPTARVFSDSMMLLAFLRQYPEPRRHYSPFLPQLRTFAHQKGTD